MLDKLKEELCITEFLIALVIISSISEPLCPSNKVEISKISFWLNLYISLENSVINSAMAVLSGSSISNL